VTSPAFDALQADRDALLAICKGLDFAEYAAPSGCPGWSVKDVITHMGALFQLAVDASALPDAEGLPTERAQDVFVESRRSWTPEETVADYEQVSAEALERLSGLEGQEFELDLGDLGTYPAAMLLNAYATDHYLHIRADLHAPRGPLVTTPPPSDEFHLAPVLDWFEAAIPQQNPALMDGLRGAVEVRLDGPGARRFAIGRTQPTTRLASDANAFVWALTQRMSWEDAGIDATGDLGQIELLRAIHVF
jgi:uncharacterized protein (TIGR03083 family)